MRADSTEPKLRAEAERHAVDGRPIQHGQRAFQVGAAADEAHDQADERRDKAIDDAVHDCGERAADNNADRQVKHVAAHDKFFKLVQKFLHV